MTFINNATIWGSDNETQVTELEVEEGALELRQRFDRGDEFGAPYILGAEELRQLIALAKFLGWEL